LSCLVTQSTDRTSASAAFGRLSLTVYSTNHNLTTSTKLAVYNVICVCLLFSLVVKPEGRPAT